MTDIAAKAGVSQSTVSFVLNGRETSVRISESTRQRVLAAAEELGYRSNHLARAVRTGNTNMLGFIGGDLCEEHVGRMLDGALAEAEKQGFTLKILPHRDHENGYEHIIRRSSELRLTGVAALHLPVEMLEMIRAETKHCNHAMVLLDTPADLPGVPQVVTDDERGVFLAIEHLVALGHTRIALISSDPIASIAVLREQAFHHAMSHLGLEVPEKWVTRGDFRWREPSLQAAQALLDGPASERPTAIFCIGDLIACVTIQVAQELGLRVPRDVSVVGFGDSRLARFIVPTLTTLRQPFWEMGQRAVRCLIAQAGMPSGEPVDAQSDTCSATLPVELIERSSTSHPLDDHQFSHSRRDKLQFAPDEALRPPLVTV
ncbi:MAG TPA: LacI family DNA-binding transcriptional regulator [Abditibacterium sp.]|jgi:LacI family transcriptional regulator